MNDIDNQIEEIDISIEQAKKQISKMEALLRLTKNEDFKSIIDEGYFKEEASNLVLLKAAPGFSEEKEQTRIDRNIIAIGCLRQHLSGIMQLGMQAKKAVVDHEQLREEVLSEEGN